MDGFSPLPEGEDRIVISEELISYSTLMNIDTFTEISSPSIGYQVLSDFISSSQENVQAQARSPDDIISIDADQNSEQNLALATTSCSALLQADASSADYVSNSVPRLIIGGVSIEERLLKALSLLKVAPRGGILAQIWMPIKQGNECVLSTSEQPYLLDQILAGYREVSRTFTFSGRDTASLMPGLPSRVFLSGVPEWTSNIVYYNRLEYLRVDHAIKHEIRGSLALPIFAPDEKSCCAVLELVTKKEKHHFDVEIDSFCDALKVVELRSVKVHFQSKVLKNSLKMNQKSVFSEILDVLRAVCHAHMLPIALVWVPIKPVDGVLNNPSFDKDTLLCIQESACYVNDHNKQGFLHACSVNHLLRGQGLAGKAILSNRPVFSSDVKMLTVNQYPLAHHARKFGLHAAVAIRLRSNYTGNEDYVLEFFLPTNCKGSSEQQLLLNNLSVKLQKICKSLRTVSDSELVESKCPNDRTNSRTETTTEPISFTFSETPHAGGYSSVSSSFQFHSPDCHGEAINFEKVKSGAPRRQKKSRSTVEKNITLSVLQQYYSGTLKEAAKTIGVCPTTLKRICRLNGISRWPSRKISKVNHSVKKIQNVMDSVPGVGGKIKYEYTTGKLITEVLSQEKETIVTLESPGHCEVPISSSQLVDNNQLASRIRTDMQQSTENSSPPKPVCSEQDKKTTYPVDCTNLADNGTYGVTLNHGYADAVNLNRPIPSKSSSSKLALEEMQTEKNSNDAKVTPSSWLFGISHPFCSSMTNPSTGSASSDQAMKMNKVNMVPAGIALRVKASYKEDTVRFKFFPSTGLDQLLEEVAKRFKLSEGTFQLKYKDDEEEWVIMSNEDDLKECTDVLESMDSQNLRLLVRDIPCGFDSSTGSNSMFMGS